MASSPDVAGSPPRRSCATASTTPGLRPDRWVGALERRFAPAGDGTPSTATPVVGRHHLNLDAGRAVQPRNVATQTEGSIIYALGQCCGRRSPSGTAASWNPTTPATKVTHVGRVQHRDQGGVDRQSSDRRRPGRNLRSSAPTQRSGPRLGVVDIIQVADRLSERS
jgi:hypothetical protein